MSMPFETLRRKWLKDAKFRAEHERIGPDMAGASSTSSQLIPAPDRDPRCGWLVSN